ncbi:Hypothetical predicted protein [Pelobates cultripes]|uniref:Uncharacterized protein n=1 Tax=Pelobates cultripes TaxID=61616 RepID=A0AAD1RNW9_PELCU|nr:Hypothetical predicted protein [Pelobates cultripes]
MLPRIDHNTENLSKTRNQCKDPLEKRIVNPAKRPYRLPPLSSTSSQLNDHPLECSFRLATQETNSEFPNHFSEKREKNGLPALYNKQPYMGLPSIDGKDTELMSAGSSGYNLSGVAKQPLLLPDAMKSRSSTAITKKDDFQHEQHDLEQIFENVPM